MGDNTINVPFMHLFALIVFLEVDPGNNVEPSPTFLWTSKVGSIDLLKLVLSSTRAFSFSY